MRYAFRRLRATPLFTIAATITLAIAIGATASVFGVVDGVLLKAFPYRNPERVMTLWESSPPQHQPRATVAAATYFAWAAESRRFSAMAATCCDELWFTVTRPDGAERVNSLAVTANYFQVLGITPIVGRPLAPDTSGPNEVVLSYGYWQRRYGGDRSVVGQRLTLDDANDARPTPRHSYTIVGVMPPGLPGDTEMWTLIFFEPGEDLDYGYRYLDVFGRLAPGATVAGARSEMEAITQRIAAEHPKTNQQWSVTASPLLDSLIGPARPALLMLLGAAGCVLIIGAANLANLFLVRCLAREREIAVRTALGATRSRLVRELIAEAAALGLIAGALGVGVAVIGLKALRAVAPPTLPRVGDAGADWRVIAFCAVASVTTVFIFGVLPAWQASRGSLAAALKEGGRGTGSAQQRRLQDGLAVLQVAVALVLLTGAGLLVTSFVRFRQMDPGFRPERVLTARVTLSRERYLTRADGKQFFTRVLDELAARPDIVAASVSSWVPTSQSSMGTEPIVILGDPPPDSAHGPVGKYQSVSPDYFRTMGIKLLRGRLFLPTDDGRAVHVAVINDLLARRFFAGREPIGRRVVVVERDTVAIVGVIASVRGDGLAADVLPEIYADDMQSRGFFVGFVEARTRGNPDAQANMLRSVITSADPFVAVSDVQTMDERMMRSIGMTRFSSTLASLFAVVALVLGIIGIYSVLAYIVSQRQREMAVRLALGANHGHLVRGVIWRAAQLTLTGILIGSAAGWALTQALSALFLGVSPHDPVIVLGAPMVFVAVALLATIVPAMRATRVDPVAALSSQ